MTGQYAVQRIESRIGGGHTTTWLRVDKHYGSFDWVEHKSHAAKIAFYEAVALAHVAKLEQTDDTFFFCPEAA